MVRALLLLQDYSSGLSRTALDSLTEGEVGNHDIAILLHLHTVGPQHPSDIADDLGYERSQSSKHLARLESRGMIAREPDPADGRRHRVTLTPQALERIARFEAALGEYYATSESTVTEILTLMNAPPQDPAPNTRGVLEAAAMMSAAGDRYLAEVVPALAAYGVGDDFAERFIIGTLLARGAQRPGHLARELGRPPALVSLRLARLEEAELVTRERGGPHDRRAIIVNLTPTGRRAARTMLRLLARHAADIGLAIGATINLTRDQTVAATDTAS
jgi:DNA-binding MarR family transcriptional regulator